MSSWRLGQGLKEHGVGSSVVVPAVVAPERHLGGLDRDARRDARDADKLRNAGRFAFMHFW